MDEKGRIQHKFEPEIERSISTATPTTPTTTFPWKHQPYKRPESQRTSSGLQRTL